MADWLYQIGTIALEAVNQSGPPVLIALFLVTFLGELAVPFPWLQDIIFYYIGFQHWCYRDYGNGLVGTLGVFPGAE